jgi:hypothetical protein
MARIAEIFVIANALAGIATYMGVRLIWRRSKNKAKRGFDIIRVDKDELEEEWDDLNNGGTPPGKELPEVPSGERSLSH